MNTDTNRATANATASVSGIGFGGLLAIVFITLKLLGLITWPWLWVLSPLWIPLAFMAAVFVIIAAIAGLVTLFTKKKKKR